MAIQADTIVRRNEDIVFGEYEGEIALLDIESGDHFGLNETGARIWEMLETTHRVADLIAALDAEFDAPAETLSAEVFAFIERMVASRIVEIAVETG